jgi:hypothetical protein
MDNVIRNFQAGQHMHSHRVIRVPVTAKHTLKSPSIVWKPVAVKHLEVEVKQPETLNDFLTSRGI